MKRINIAVIGASDITHSGPESIITAYSLGKEIEKNKMNLLTGAGLGFSLAVAHSYKEEGGVLSIGISPASSVEEHVNVYRLGVEDMDLIVYSGFGVNGKDDILLRSVDAVIFSCLRVGQTNEFFKAYYMNLPIGILKGDWKIDEIMSDVLNKESQNPNSLICVDSNPAVLLSKLTEKIIKNKGFSINVN